MTLWKGDRANETLTTGVVATNDDECHSNRNNLPNPDAVIIERIPYLDNFYHADVKTQREFIQMVLQVQILLLKT